MKKVLFIVFINLIFACTNKRDNAKEVTIIIKKGIPNHNPIGNLIIVTFKNNSNAKFPITLMSCDYSQNFISNNKKVIFPTIECDKNIPKLYILKPLEEKQIKLYVISDFGIPKQKFKIGLIHYNRFNKDYNSTKKEHQKIQNIETEKIIWSNQLTL